MRELQTTEYDVVVLGAGPTGENVADYARRGGLTVAVVEAELVGGECSYWACIPSKALLRPVDVLDAVRGVPGAREAVTGPLDAAAALARRDAFVGGFLDAGQVSWLEGTGSALVRGTGRLAGERRVEVTGPEGDTELLTARHAVVVCTGTAAAVPPVPGLAEARPWTSRDATTAKEAPRRLAVLGGGVVGVEMATAWRALGSEQVTVLQRGPRLLPGHEPEAADRLAAALRERGVDVRLSAEVTEVRREGDGPVRLTVDGEVLEADEVLVAAGRTPRTGDVGLETVGLRPGAPLAVDDSLRVPGVPGGWLYAAGDCTDRARLTHMGKYEARACGTVIAARAAGEPAAQDPAPWSRYAATADSRAVPQVVFTSPQVASVGLTERQARERGLRVVTSEYELGSVAGAALLADGYSGWAKLVVDTDRLVVIGATFLGSEVAELLHSATIAVAGEVPVERLWHAVPAFPTMSEVWLRLLDALPDA
ncbi:MAG: NAD(P)/FAD-dependent oxidoreductase [Actinomycetota bacterium]|nr:NAD(P)/FAD-dependent oxidoreductase [Actinomycetota bacterium]